VRLALALTLLAGAAAAETPASLPFALGGPFALTDQTGAERTEADPEGRPQLLFFGYANCQQICSAALPLMADVADLLAAEGTELGLVMITVDPARDTVAAMASPLAAIHPGFTGLTGTEAELQVAYDAFAIEREELFVDPEYGPVFAHGSMIYLLDGSGAVQTLLPPVLSAERMAEIVRGYADAAG
jgi:protein SCO1/2